jgi:hypothetical protein
MRRSLITLLAILMLVPDLCARTNHDWENVKKLKPGTPVEVFLWSGEALSGKIEAVTDSDLQLATAGSSGPGIGWLRDLPRTNIQRIVRMRHANLPDPKRWMIGGALAGGAIGLTAGAASDIKHGNNGRWLLDGFGGAVLGFFGSCVALAAVGTVELVRDVHHHKIVYEDTGSRAAPSA